MNCRWYSLHYEKFSDGTIKCIQEDIPFKLPPRWEWCRLKSICSVLTDGTHQTPTYSDCGYVFLSSKNVTEGRIDWDNVMFIPENLHKELYTRIAPNLNDILLAKNGTTGVAAIVDKDCVFDIYVSLALIRIVSDIISPQYILNAIGSYFVQSFFKKSLKGIGVPNLHLERIRETLLPIPPYNEQIKITKTTNNLISLCEKIGSEKNSLSSLVTLAKNKILDLAIRGKLVSQDPNDEPASILLERIRKEKEELIMSGKLKRDKRESVIFRGEDNSYYEIIGSKTVNIKDELPYNIPSTWIWVRLGTIGIWGAGATPNRAHSEYYGGGIPWLKTGDLNDDYITEIPETITELALKETSVKLNPAGSILIAMYGATIGKLGILTKPATTNQACCACFPVEGVYNKYLFYFLMSHKSKFINRGIGGAQPNISKEKIVATLMPLPPINEQKAIVARIEKLSFLLNSINADIV